MNLRLNLHHLTLALMLLAPAAFAQTGGSFELTWATLDGGGGDCAGTDFKMSATIGQVDAGTPAIGGSFALTGGFWSDAYEVGPELHIASSSGSVIISWPASATGFHLEHCTDLTRRNWVSNSSPVLKFGEDKVVIESTVGIRFYRLIKP